MTLDEFIAESIADVERFRAMWNEGAQQDPSAFPPTLNPGDWHDQFMLFLSNGDESGAR